MLMFDSTQGKFVVVGVTSYGTDGPDMFDNGSRFGDIAVDTRVQSFQNFIMSDVPEPSSALLLAAGIVGLALRGRRPARP